MSNVYCAFCGVILLQDPDGDDEPGSPPLRARPWYAEVPGLTSTDTGDHATLTGVGLIRGRNVLHAPVDSNLSYVEGESLGEWGLSTTQWGPWAFGVHHSCWQILLLRLSHLHESEIATSVFHQLLCIPCVESSRFDFGHDYDGASQTHKTLGRPQPVDEASSLYADPCGVPSPNTLEIRTPPPSTASHHLQSGSSRRFGSLSPELIYEILSYLSCKEVAALRLVHLNLAEIAAVNSLPQSYWRTRFLLGQEADFMFPNLTDRRDWCGLFSAARGLLQSGRNLSFLNRRRIRNLIEPIALVVEQDAASRPGLYGIPVYPVPNQEIRFQLLSSEGVDHPPRLLETFSSFTGHVTSTRANEPLYDGCRVLYHRTQPLPYPRQYDQGSIAISTRQIGGMTFISGLGIFPSSMSDDAARIVGVHDPFAAKWVEIPPASAIEHIYVALCSKGLTGIMFIFTNCTASPWTGVSEGPGVAQGLLTATGKSRPSYLLAGLDLYKIISSGIYDLVNDPDFPSGTSSQPTVLRPQSHLWVPCPPTYDSLQLSALYPPLPILSFEPLLNIDFGGPGGLYLSRLTELVCYMGYDPHPVLGMKAIYADGRSRVTEIGILNYLEDYVRTTMNTQVASRGLCGLQVTTNHGRRATFATIRSCLRNDIDIIQGLEFDHIITGLAVRRMPSRDPFIRVALQYQPSAEPPLRDNRQPLHPSPETHRASLEYDKDFSSFIRCQLAGDYQTCASLKGVRRIQASIEVEGRSRAPDRISGLKLFYGSAPPAILGQWMDEYTIFELLSDEDIECLTVWIVPLAYSAEWRTQQLGQVVAIRINTTQARTIFWILNSSYGRVRADGCDNLKRPSTLLPARYPPVNQVQKLYFDSIQRTGYRDPVVTAKAYIRDAALLGLVFMYMSGATARIGDVDTASDNVETVHFSQNARVVGMSTGVKDGHIRSLKFELEVRRPAALGMEYKTVGLGVPSPDEHRKTPKYDWQHVWCKDESAQGFRRQRVRDDAYAAPTGMRLAGFYVGCQDFSSLGGLYEPESNEDRGGAV
ncbi:hypothetical protein BDW59DRAFT_182360 [Aspergillus cavernicola]|uniref:DUF7600 domain-containing protein n=1 Tax=Aspergillus cavernicola TaxID=176166 RepID=A0ABR4HNT4_9EURO